MEQRDTAASNEEPPRAPHRLRVLQWNAQGLRNKKHEVQQAVVEEDLDVVLLQETLTPADFEWRVAGYIHPALTPHCRGWRPRLLDSGEELHTSHQNH